MKIIKTVKYNYKLTEETLEKDISEFIKTAKRGDFQMDRHYSGEGLKVIKQYFRILLNEFKKGEFEECKTPYEKLILFCIDASGANNCDNLFDYEDLLAKITKDFDSYIKNYFICLVKTCNVDELAERVARYASHLDIYGFESDTKILVEHLNKEKIDKFEEKMLAKIHDFTKHDKDKQDILYFLLNLAAECKDKEKYMHLCDLFKAILDDEELDSLREEYDENN